MISTAPVEWETKPFPFSRSLIRSYWRSGLLRLLHKPEILQSIRLDNQVLHFETTSWKNYWDRTPSAYTTTINNLEIRWRDYIESGFSPQLQDAYCRAILQILKTILEESTPIGLELDFLRLLLGFENIPLFLGQEDTPFAMMTTSFRNPFFVSFWTQGIKVGMRGTPRLLPLATARYRYADYLFYHYRKQKILKNSNENLLFFPRVELEERPASFQGLTALEKVLVPQWDTRINERANLLSKKVLIPIIRRLENRHKSFRILDIGSGDGVFTAHLMTKILQSNILEDRKIELSLLDIISGIAIRPTKSDCLLKGLSCVERISSDYLQWLANSNRRYDMVFFFRMLHNMSHFEIRKILPDTPANRYPVIPSMNGYYRAMQIVHPEIGNREYNSCHKDFFHPFRLFNEFSLILHDGSSLIKLLSLLADNLIIEDADLTDQILLRHLVQHKLTDLFVYDFSRYLRLSINHIYWITRIPCDHPHKVEQLWPL